MALLNDDGPFLLVQVDLDDVVAVALVEGVLLLVLVERAVLGFIVFVVSAVVGLAIALVERAVLGLVLLVAGAAVGVLTLGAGLDVGLGGDVAEVGGKDISPS